MTAATWIMPTAQTISSLDTGKLIYITAWGGSEIGYAYTFTLSGAPSGVTIDNVTAYITVATAQPAGVYTFSVIATNRESSETASFTFTLTVLQGVTSGRSGTQILHKTYDPFDSGSFGSPTGNNWTVPLNAIGVAVKADQVTNGDEKLRATIIFRHGVTYQYTNNEWNSGFQYYLMTDDPAHLVGANPILQCINTGSTYQNGPMHPTTSTQAKAPCAVNHQDGAGIKVLCALTQDAVVGATTLTLINSGDASRIKAGRFHAMTGQNIQRGGFPPSTAYIDYFKVVSVVGSTITIDRPLKYRYSSSWFNEGGDQDFGAALLVPWDLGGTGGAVPTAERLTLQGFYQNITFLANPNGDNISYVDSHINFQMDSCALTNPQFSMCQHSLLTNCTTTGGGEPDKLSETIIFDGGTTTNLGGATGFQYWYTRNTSHGDIQVSPRQLRAASATFKTTSGTNPPVSFSYNGPKFYFDFKSCTFQANGSGTTTWTYGYNTSEPTIAPLTIGSNGCVWSGNKLIIPTTYANFENWMTASWEGMILSTTSTLPVTTNWGYVSTISSDGAGTQLWLNVVWVNGTKPLSGSLWGPNSKNWRLNMESTNVFTAPMSFIDPGWIWSNLSSFGTSRGLPAGYPVPGNNAIAGAGMAKAQSMGTGVPSLVGAPIVNGVGTGLSVSKGQGALTQFNAGGITFTLTNVTGTFP